jgi:23S rRNA U2552 (ribose-2'-O)-methylase RlmE/FtsJ
VNRDSVFKAGESQGKSGSFFFFSHDKKFIIKTMTSSDLSTFKKLFKSYFEGVSTRRTSLLARIYGIYTIKMEEVEPVHLILMGNSKQSIDKNIVNIFDLKGSFINREVNAKGLKPTATLKDLNLLEICKNTNLLLFRPEDQKVILDNLERDVALLRKKNIMDYSLLLAVENNPEYHALIQGGTLIQHKLTLVTSDGTSQIREEDVEAMRRRIACMPYKFLSKGGRYIYHVSIIDYLQDFNLDKKLENAIKTVINKPDAQISAIDPQPYANRYLKFMREKVIIDMKKNTGAITSTSAPINNAGGHTPI